MDDDARWYFAYGSNMQDATFIGRRKIEPLGARAARLPAYRLCFDIPVGPGARGVANLSVAADADVWGVLYLLTPSQHEHLDRTEGVPLGLYRRIDVEVETCGERIMAQTLISENRDPSRRPSHRYRGILIEGAREHGLPEHWLATLENWELAWDEREGSINPPGVVRA